MDNQILNKNDKRSKIQPENFKKIDIYKKCNKFASSFIGLKRPNLYKNLIKDSQKNSNIIKPRKKISIENLPLYKSNKLLNNFSRRLSNAINGLSTKDALYFGSNNNHNKYLRSNDLNGYLSNSIMIQPKEAKYFLMEKNIQNKLLDISMEIYENRKINSDLSDESEPIAKRSKKLKKSSKNNLKFSSSKKISNKYNRKSFPNTLRSMSIKSNDNSIFTHMKEQQIEKTRKIVKKTVLYDSMAEDESDENIEEDGFGLSPESLFICIFDLLLLISSLLCLFYFPYRLAKTKLNFDEDEYIIRYIIIFSELIYIFDMIFGFFRWYYNNELKIVKNNKMVIANYLWGYFLMDLIEAIPFFSILRYINLKNKINDKNEDLFSEKYFILKIFSCFKAFKIFKINERRNNYILNAINNKLSESYLFERIYQISNFAIITLSVLNIFICLHIYMGKLSYPNWIVSFKFQDKSFIEIYLSSLYFIMATMTSVGYGDIVCISKIETCFQIILLSIGVVAYSWIISTVGDYVKNESRASIKYNKDITQLEEIRIAYPNMPFKLYNNIHQHLQRSLKQKEKFDSNLLINNLPYTLKNTLIFEIHKEIIHKFIFFRGCENSDFILRILTRFIPLYSKKNSFLIKEGETIENIFFVKDGRLSLEAAIDLDNIEDSIEKYLEHEFGEISSLIESEIEISLNKINNIIKKEEKEKKNKIQNQEELLDVINKLSQNIGNISYMHESNIEEEIGKCDFNEELENLELGNHQFLHIIDILKNENFGEIYLNKPCPLSLRVKSKKVDLFLLRKKDAINIKNDYPNIWKRIIDKARHNMKAIKALTRKVINRYCKINGILHNKEMIERSQHLLGDGGECNSSKDKEISDISNEFDSPKKTKMKKLNSVVIRKKRESEKYFNILSPKNKRNTNTFQSCILRTTKKSKEKNDISFQPKNDEKSEKKKKENSNNIEQNINKEINNDHNNQEENANNIKNINKYYLYSPLNKNSNMSLNEVIKSLNEKISNNNINIQQEEKINNNNNNNSSNKEKNNHNLNNILFQLSKMQDKPMNCHIYNTTYTTSKLYNNVNSLFNSDSQNINQVNNFNNNLTNYNNLVISNTNYLYQIPEFPNTKSNGEEDTKEKCKCSFCVPNKLIKDSNIKLEFLSSYKNIDKMSKGTYIKNNAFQKAVQRFINYYYKNLIRGKKEKISDKEEYLSSFEFSSFDNNYINGKNSIFESDYKEIKSQNKSSNIAILKELNFSENKDNKNNSKKMIMKNNFSLKSAKAKNIKNNLNDSKKYLKLNSYSKENEKRIIQTPTNKPKKESKKRRIPKFLSTKIENKSILSDINAKSQKDLCNNYNNSDLLSIKPVNPNKSDKKLSYNIKRKKKKSLYESIIDLKNINNKSNQTKDICNIL